MTNDYDYDYDAAAKLIYDETNATDSNILKDLFAILTKLVLILVSIYVFVYVSSGVVLKCLPIEKQVKLEQFMSAGVDFKNVATETDNQRINNIRNKIMKIDRNFPKTSNLQIGIIEKKYKNAFCYPNGNIYITTELYKDLKDDEMLTFIVAHEIAHYKNKDHLMSLRTNIANSSVVLFMSVVSLNNKSAVNLVDSSIQFTSLKHSRIAEQKADKYAAQVLKRLYGNTSGGVRTLKILSQGEILKGLDIVSTHPSTNSRIKLLERY